MVQAYNNISTFSVVGDDDYSPEQRDLSTLANLISRFAPHDGSIALPVVLCSFKRICDYKRLGILCLLV